MLKQALLKNPWLLILTLALLLRLLGLSLNPIGLSHDDEIQELINSKSLAVTGQPSGSMVAGIFGGAESCPGNCVYGELGSYILVPWMRFFPLSLFWSKIPFVVASVLMVFFTGKMFEHLSKNKQVGLLAGLIVAINPWAIHFGRTAYLIIFSYLFYLVAGYFLTRNKSYKSNLVYGTIFSVVGSLFYFGTKPILPFIVIWGIVYNFYTFRKFDLKFSVLILAICGAFLLFYFNQLSTSFAGRRAGEIGLNGFEITSLVDEQRRVALPMPLRDVFINKFTVSATILLEKYLGFFTPSFLYIKSAGSTDLYYISNHAYNFFIDFPFLVLGIIALASLPSAIFTLSFVAIAALPATFKVTGDTIYAVRAGLAYPLLSGITGWGIYYGYQKIKIFQKKHKFTKRFRMSSIYVFLVGGVYLASLIYFLVMYWYRVPIDKSRGWYFHKRVLSNYVSRLRQESEMKIIVITAQPLDTFNTYVFYSGKYENIENISEINKVYSSKNYDYLGTLFTNDCQKVSEQEMKNGVIVFVEQGVGCNPPPLPSLKIANPKDSGGLYDIYNETVCKGFPKNKYPYPRSIYDFQVENMSKEEFCAKWITSPD